jgi:hypothetical protein
MLAPYPPTATAGHDQGWIRQAIGQKRRDDFVNLAGNKGECFNAGSHGHISQRPRDRAAHHDLNVHLDELRQLAERVEVRKLFFTPGQDFSVLDVYHQEAPGGIEHRRNPVVPD